MNRQMIAVTVLALTAFVSGCSVDGDITDETRRVTMPRMAPLSGLIPGAQHNIKTAAGYNVSASVGSPFDAPAVVTTSGGYKVYSNVQGNINAETYETIRE
jgi:hypothetical protein